MNEFDRNVWCLLGIPVDVISFNQALEKITLSIRKDSRCFFSTPNLNFIIESSKSSSFRGSIVHSDLSLIDGMPLVWIARLLGIPGVEKVSGSDLFEALWNFDTPNRKKIRIFLFGGTEGIAERACLRINSSSAALECVGFCFPGFGSVEEMSLTTILHQISESNADIVLVALGAIKGQSWILRNRKYLGAPIVGHLGAVINFAAGNVKRAPSWMQKRGLEWVWRILQEPELWRRYLLDGLSFSWLLTSRVLPYLFWKIRYRELLKNGVPVRVQVETLSGAVCIYLEGQCLYENIESLRNVFHRESERRLPIQLELSNVRFVDGAFLGLCLILYKKLDEQKLSLSFRGLNPSVRKIFRWNCVEFLL